jgi:hypothetical protein
MPGPQQHVSSVNGEPLTEPCVTQQVGAREFAEWLREKVPSLRDLWVHEIQARGLGRSRDGDRIVPLFAERLVHLLPLMLGPNREQIQPLWDRGFALFGAVAAKRGLAAGEVIDELHLLRELVIRDLYKDPPMGGTIPLSLREVLRLNRALDRAVTHASVGHTDALFFEFFETEGAPLLSGDDVIAEAEAQLDGIADEVRLTLRASGDGARPYREN